MKTVGVAIESVRRCSWRQSMMWTHICRGWMIDVPVYSVVSERGIISMRHRRAAASPSRVIARGLENCRII